MLPAAARLRRSADFSATMRAARAVRADGLVVLHLAVGAAGSVSGADGAAGAGSAATGSRVGFVVPRAVGPAVTRNRVRRRLRHLLRDRLDRLPAGTRLVIRVLPPAAGATSATLGRAVDRALDRVLPQVPA